MRGDTVKNLIKKIGQNKFQFFFFVGILALLAVALIVSASLSHSDDPVDPNPPVVVPPVDPDDPVITQPEEVFKLPFQENTDYKVVRKFFNKDASREEQAQSLIKYGNSYRTSNGTGLAKKDNTTFDVLSTLSGKVLEIKSSPLYGNYVVVEHNDNVKVYYYGLTDVTVTVGAEVAQGDKLGTSGYTEIDKEAGNHVFIQVLKENTYLNFESLVGKKISEIK
jgi:stage II sporulation protein